MFFANAIPNANKALGCTHSQTFLLANVVAERRQNMPNYAQPTFIWRLETRLMISRTMRMVELAKGVGAIFQGKEKATNKSRHCLTGNLPICISYPQVNKDFWLWGNNCSNVILNKLMTVMKVWLPKSCDLLVKNVLNPFNEFSLL